MENIHIDSVTKPTKDNHQKEQKNKKLFVRQNKTAFNAVLTLESKNYYEKTTIYFIKKKGKKQL